MDNRELSVVINLIEQFVRGVANPFIDGTIRDTDPFRVLVSCILSLRTKDELTAVVAPRLFALADTPQKLDALDVELIARTIYPVGFYRNKAKTLKHIAATIIERYAGHVPDCVDELVKIKGIGRKTANLVVSVAYDKPAVCVDTHVHRVMNRLGYVQTGTPDKTEQELRKKLPKRYWKKINNLLVRFGKSICTPISPHCSECPVASRCGRIGVQRAR